MPNPYIAGTPVKGNRFYGREEQLSEVLESQTRICFCALASRRFGKTSFLRQLEWLCDHENLPFLPVYSNVEGVRSEDGLCTGLFRGMSGPESKPRFKAVGLEAAQLRSRRLSLSDLTLELQIAANDHGKTLLLLCDECENLIPLGEQDSALLGRLRGIMQQDGVRTVIVGSRRLAELNAIKLWGSPFLNGWESLHLLPRLLEDDASALIQQEKTGEGLNLSADLIAEILEKTNCHPYLIQAVCSQLWEQPPTRANIEKAYNQAFAGCGEQAFADDFRYLSPSEQAALQKVLKGEPVSEGHETERLEGAGYIVQRNGVWDLSNWFFERWLNDNQGRLDQIESVVSDGALKSIFHPETETTKACELADFDQWVDSATATTRTRGFERWAGGNQAMLALVFTDIVGSTVLSTELGDETMKTVRQAHFQQARSLIQKHGGYEIKTIGDAFMVAFRAATAALDFALEFYANTGDPRILIRAGVHVGQISIEDGDAFGTMVNFASRVVGMAHGAEVWLSDRAHGDIEDVKSRSYHSLQWQRHPDCEIKSFAGKRILWSLAPRETITMGNGPLAGSNAAILAKKIADGAFDVFLCHNSADKTAVKEIGEKLKEQGILPWLDEWELRPGMPWQDALEQQIKTIGTAAVFVGKNGLGAWQDLEQEAFLRQFVKRKCPLIPVILPSSPQTPKLPLFLEGMMWVHTCPK